jgi:hypothetical protein
MADLSKLRELVAQSCRMLGKLNLTKEPSGMSVPTQYN